MYEVLYQEPVDIPSINVSGNVLDSCDLPPLALVTSAFPVPATSATLLPRVCLDAHG
jgi:hypothetical protein